MWHLSSPCSSLRCHYGVKFNQYMYVIGKEIKRARHEMFFALIQMRKLNTNDIDSYGSVSSTLHYSTFQRYYCWIRVTFEKSDEPFGNGVLRHREFSTADLRIDVPQQQIFAKAHVTRRMELIHTILKRTINFARTLVKTR